MVPSLRKRKTQLTAARYDRIAHCECTETNTVCVAAPALQHVHASILHKVQCVHVLSSFGGVGLYSRMASSSRADLFCVEIRCIASSLARSRFQALASTH